MLAPGLKDSCVVTVGSAISAAFAALSVFHTEKEDIRRVLASESLILIVLTCLSGLHVCLEIYHSRFDFTKVLAVLYWTFFVLFLVVHSLLLIFYFDQANFFPISIFGPVVYLAAILLAVCFNS
jgi:FtsH-binding integral membrane protein